MEKNTNFDFRSFNLLVFLYRKRKVLMIVTAVAAIASIVVSLVITPKYQSSMVFFPATNTSASKALIADNMFSTKDILKFGDEEEVEQLLQVLQSDEIKNRIIEKYDLMEHYDIDKDSKYKYSALDRQYYNNINFRKTKYMSIEVSVLDKDPELAAAIANDIGRYLDSTMNNMQNEMADEAFQIVKREYLSLKKDIKELEDSLQDIRQQGLYDYETQAKALNDAYAQALANNQMQEARRIEKRLKVLSDYGAIYQSLNERLQHENERLSQMKSKYQEARVDAKNDLPHKFIVNNAYVPERKAKPVRSLIVIVSTLSAFVMCVLILMLIEYIRRLRAEELL